MLVGHEKLTETFKQLIKDDRLSHGYIFFGEPQVGKFTFALSLATYLETGEFGESTRPLGETSIIQPDEEGSISINNIRNSKYFLFQKPVYSSYRVVIVNDAEKLTPQAQHAILKIAEEPPGTALIILIVSNPDALLPTIQSRLQKIYFPRVSSNLIIKTLINELKLTKAQAADIAKISFGRPGRAIRLAENGKWKTENRSKKNLIEELIDDSEAMNQYFTQLIAELAEDPVKNYKELKIILNRATLISEFNTNKRLQLESALWNI
ncbi:MAG: hypothetical protein HYS88_00990 [Candidatus Colwellbacteria bacterium]|nr:hypothetical protein [Candidatus Colwellbacteria bacterium]